MGSYAFAFLAALYFAHRASRAFPKALNRASFTWAFVLGFSVAASGVAVNPSFLASRFATPARMFASPWALSLRFLLGEAAAV